MTRLGWVFLVVIVVSLALGFLGPHVVRVPGLAIGFVGLVMLIAENAGMASRRGLATERRDAEHALPVPEEQAVEASEDAWRREREQRDLEERRQRSDQRST